MALQLCAKCGTIGQGRLDWHESEEMDTETIAAIEAAMVKADYPGEDTAAVGEGTQGSGAESDSTHDAMAHSIFDRILRGGGGGDLQPGTGSLRFFCMKCWRELRGDEAEYTDAVGTETNCDTGAVNVDSVSPPSPTNSLQP